MSKGRCEKCGYGLDQAGHRVDCVVTRKSLRGSAIDDPRRQSESGRRGGAVSAGQRRGAPLPSETFDWDCALESLRRILREVYGRRR